MNAQYRQELTDWVNRAERTPEDLAAFRAGSMAATFAFCSQSMEKDLYDWWEEHDVVKGEIVDAAKAES